MPAQVDERMLPVYQELVDLVLDRINDMPEDKQYWVAIAGAPGSGKSTLSHKVAERLQRAKVHTTVLPMDGYHFYKHELSAMPDPQEAFRRRGSHWTFNAEKFVRDMKAAREKGEGSFPNFQHGIGDPEENALHLDRSHRVVLVEGNYVLLYHHGPWDQLDSIFDEKWYIQVDMEVARERIIKRHVASGRRTEEEARARADTNDIPNGILIDECKKYADRIVFSQ